eukprot:5986240-Pyramimonas_sp.AAC.1
MGRGGRSFALDLVAIVGLLCSLAHLFYDPLNKYYRLGAVLLLALCARLAHLGVAVGRAAALAVEERSRRSVRLKVPPQTPNPKTLTF